MAIFFTFKNVFQVGQSVKLIDGDLLWLMLVQLVVQLLPEAILDVLVASQLVQGSRY